MAELEIGAIRVDEWFAGRLPPTPERELEALAADIRRRGVLVELLITEDGLFLDGHEQRHAF